MPQCGTTPWTDGWRQEAAEGFLGQARSPVRILNAERRRREFQAAPFSELLDHLDPDPAADDVHAAVLLMCSGERWGCEDAGSTQALSRVLEGALLGRAEGGGPGAGQEAGGEEPLL